MFTGDIVLSVCFPRLESGPVTADLTTTVVHSSKLLINGVKHVHSLIQMNLYNS